MSANLSQSDALLAYIDSLSTAKRKHSEMNAFDTLAKKYPKSLILKALQTVKSSGLPPYGKLTYDPLFELANDTSIMDMFAAQESAVAQIGQSPELVSSKKDLEQNV